MTWQLAYILYVITRLEHGLDLGGHFSRLATPGCLWPFKTILSSCALGLSPKPCFQHDLRLASWHLISVLFLLRRQFLHTYKPFQLVSEHESPKKFQMPDFVGTCADRVIQCGYAIHASNHCPGEDLEIRRSEL